MAFFRVPGDERPVKIYIFRQAENDSYDVATVIEGVGTGIYSVNYENVGGSQDKEVIVSWQISGDDHTLGVYSLDDVEGIELLWVDSYTRFRLSDLDNDLERELVVLSLQTGEEDASRADFYDYDGAALALKSTAPLSTGINEIKSVRSGNLAGGSPALFVTSSFRDVPDQVVDILSVREGTLTNITLNTATLRSEETVRTYRRHRQRHRPGRGHGGAPARPGPQGQRRERRFLASGVAAVRQPRAAPPGPHHLPQRHRRLVFRRAQ